LVAIGSTRFDKWQAGADIQTTDNAYIRTDISRLGARISGTVSTVAVADFATVKRGQLLLEIDPADYNAKRMQASAALDYALAQVDNLHNQINLQEAGVEQAKAQQAVALTNAALAGQELDRQSALLKSGSGTQQKSDQAGAEAKATEATAQASAAAVNSATAQLQVVRGQHDQLKANFNAARAALDAAQLNLEYTKITAPFDGVVGERQVHEGDYVSIGTNLVTILPLPRVYVTANFKETQLSRMDEGQSVDVTVDALREQVFKAHVSRLSPGAGSQFALLPADNATGNFTKVVQRIPVRIDFDENEDLGRLRPGMSVIVSVNVAGK
jgi:membrane fusion protein (multidrug efflux system)